jgi:hypothetical protein
MKENELKEARQRCNEALKRVQDRHAPAEALKK